MTRQTPHGMSLIELMIAVSIGCLLVVAALTVYSRGASTNRVNEAVARLQEQGRYALSVIEADVEHAGLYGFTNTPELIRLVAGGNGTRPLNSALAMRQSMPAVVGLPGGAHTCGRNFAVDVTRPLQGSNDVFDLACAAYGSGAAAATDVLTVRRTDPRDAPTESGRLQIYSSRLGAAHFLFADGNAPGPVGANQRVQNLLVRVYYIARDSVSRPGFPALRAKTLSRSGSNVVFDEDEIMTGIEDLQVQFGLDTGDYDNDGAIDRETDADGDGTPDSHGRITRYVSPDFPSIERHRVGAVRIWLRIRADAPEVGFSDQRTYRYADVTYTPAGGEAQYRRALISRTIAVRNARVY